MKIAGKDPNGNAKGVAVTENGEVKVQQTGSNVLLINVDRVVNAGATTSITQLDLNGYREFHITAYPDGVHDYVLRYDIRDSQGNYITQELVGGEKGAHYLFNQKLKTGNIYVFVDNKDTLQHTYHIEIRGEK